MSQHSQNDLIRLMFNKTPNIEDRDIEAMRYGASAATIIDKGACDVGGSESIQLVLRAPYLRYEKMISSSLTKDMRVLELGAGTGRHSLILCADQIDTVCSDIAPKALEVLQLRIKSKGHSVETVATPMESTPFVNNSFDLIASAGSLSYADPETLNMEITRILKPGGSFICVDSLNHNPIYRFNRWIHWRIKKDRTRSTLIRMPTIARMRQLGEHFESWELEGFGAASWLLSPLSRIIGSTICARLSTLCDRLPGARRMAFKFVFVARGLKKASPNAT